MPADAPLFQQLKERMRAGIADGTWRPGDRLPSTAELCATYRISAITVRRALTDLVGEGLLRGAQGRGMFVAAHPGPARQATSLIGLVLPGAGSGFLQAIRIGIERELGGATPLVMGVSDMDPDREATLVERLAADGVAGLLLVPITGVRSAAGDARVAAAIASRLPTVLVDRTIELPTVDSVTSDNVQAGRLATAHLLALGHRRIACIWAHECPTFSDRRRGWEEALRGHGVTPDPELARGGWQPGSDYESCGYLRTLELFHHASPPTAIVACNDPLALGALRALRFLGRAVPGAVSVIGNDDVDLAAAAGLTSVRQDCEEIGRQAAALLTRRIAGDTAPAVALRLPTTLTVRTTTGAAT